jgi:cell division septation protein DedD
LPSPSAAPQPASTGLPTVTKHPTDETVDIGGECVFIANYSNAIWAVWHFVSPDGKTDYRFDDKAMQTAFPGLKVENGMYSNMSLKNIPAELNGWRVCCEYRNNSGSVRTNYATVNVRGAEAALAAAAPEPTPTPTPEPTPTPTPEPTPTPTPTPETSPNPTESPEETREEASKSTEKRSGSHVILMLAAGFAVAAVVICGGILLIYKHRGE